MDFGTIGTWLTLDHMMDLFGQYRSFGPIPGIMLPALEAFLPFLPLALFVVANANAFGLWMGFLYSWLGASLGAIFVFLLVRRFGQQKTLAFLTRHSKVQKLMQWIERHGFGPIFLLVCFPFTPSAIVNVVAGLSKISPAQYILAIVTGKMVTIFMVSYIGYDLHSLLIKPLRTITVAMIILILWYVGKRIEVRLNRSMERVNNMETD